MCVQLNWETVGILGHRCKGYLGARFRSDFRLWGQKDFMFVEKIIVHSLFIHMLFNVLWIFNNKSNGYVSKRRYFLTTILRFWNGNYFFDVRILWKLFEGINKLKRNIRMEWVTVSFRLGQDKERLKEILNVLIF